MKKFNKAEQVTINPHLVKYNPNLEGVFEILDTPVKKNGRKIYGLKNVTTNFVTYRAQRNLVKIAA